MTPDTLLELLLIAGSVRTAEDRARLAWRMNDLMWTNATKGRVELGVARQFNNAVQDLNEKENWPWVKDLFTAEEREAFYPRAAEQ